MSNAPPLTADAVAALAPDAASLKAARGLLGLKGWGNLGIDGDAAWGECQGSGAKPYQTQVDLRGAAPSFKCSCPSRKFPCKHGLALMLLTLQSPAAFGNARPAWVAEWLDSRKERAQQKEVKQAAAVQAAADPAAREAKLAQRWTKAAKALPELKRWLSDQVERGLGALDAATRPQWETMAARMVDAQCPGLATRIRAAAEHLGGGAAAPLKLLRELGQLQLISEALERQQTLSEVQRADLIVQLGWPTTREEVLALGERLRDAWTVLGQIEEEREGKLRERRVWLAGARSGRMALFIDHAHGDRPFEALYLTGTAFEAELIYYPGSAPLRAMPGGEVSPAAATIPGDTLAAAWARLAARLALRPYAGVQPLVLAGARLSVPAAAAESPACLVVDDRLLPHRLGRSPQERLLAYGGGHPLRLFGEWDGEALQPLSAWNEAEPALVPWQVQA